MIAISNASNLKLNEPGKEKISCAYTSRERKKIPSRSGPGTGNRDAAHTL